jgi:Fe-S oxidoreductase
MSEEDENDEPEYDEIPGSFKVIGPIDTYMCKEVFDAVVRMLKKMGFEVAQIETADG